MINQRAFFWVSCFILLTTTAACRAVVPPAAATARPTANLVVDSAHPITLEETITVTKAITAPVTQPITPTATMTNPESLPMTSTNTTSAPNPQVEQAINDLAARTSSAPADIEVVDFAAVVWPDKGLGCPRPGMVYPQVQVDGMLIHLRVLGDSSGVTYAYHSGEGRAPFLCEAPAALPQSNAPANQEEQTMNLISAATRGDLAAVEQALAQGAELEGVDDRGQTALIAAAYGNHLEVAQRLIEAGADVNVQDQTQQSAYLITTADGYLELLKLTLAAGADVHRTDSYNGTGLIRAADRGHVEIIRELLKTDIDVDHINRLGWTALLEAIILGDGGPRHTEVVRLLVEAGTDVNIADNAGVTPLAHAQQRGYAEMVELLRANVSPQFSPPMQ